MINGSGRINDILVIMIHTNLKCGYVYAVRWKHHSYDIKVFSYYKIYHLINCDGPFQIYLKDLEYMVMC